MRIRKNLLIVFILIILSLVIVAIMPNYSYAMESESGGAISTETGDGSKNPIKNPDAYKPGTSATLTKDDTNPIVDRANQILGAIVTVGIVISVVVLTVLGIKYMVGSVEQKAEYKKTMIPYIIGVVFLISGSAVVGLIASIVENSGLGY